MSSSSAGTAGGGVIYVLGIFGALVYYFKQADTFWEYVRAHRPVLGTPLTRENIPVVAQ